MCSSTVREKSLIPFKHVMKNFHLTGDKMTSMVREKLPVVHLGPNGLPESLYNPSCEVNASLLQSVSSISTSE